MTVVLTTRQAPPPPPPPPPTFASPKYLISLSGVQDIHDIGLSFQPCQVELSEAVGAQISSIDTSRVNASQWVKRHQMKVGDVLYKIDGQLVMNMPHREIMKLLLSCKTLIFEKSRADQKIISSSNRPQSHQEEFGAKTMNTVPLSQPSTNTVMSLQRPFHSMELSSVTPQSNRGVQCDTNPSPGESSVECNVLSSIFSPQQIMHNQKVPINDNYYLSDYIYELQHDDVNNCPDLVAIPEGSRTDSSNDNSMGFITDHDDDDVDNNEYCSVTQQGSCPKEDGTCVLGSPAFSYSVTTDNTESLDPMSPLGTKIQMSVSVATILKEQEDEYSMVSSARQRYHDSQVMKLKQKYASYLSTESDRQQHTVVSASNYDGHVPLAPLDALSKTPLTTKTMYHDIPISMLDYKYVRECNSKDELEKIIDALKMKSPPEFPSLLRMAESRFSELMKPLCRNIDRDIRTEGIPSIIHVELDKDNIAELHGDDFSSAYSSQPQSMKRNFDTEDMNDIVIAHAELKGHLEELLRERDAMQCGMSSQIQSLENMLERLKLEMEKQSKDSSEKIDSLQKAKLNAEREMQVLRESCKSSSKSIEELTKELQTKESEIGKLAAELYKEQESKRIAVEKAESNSIKLQSQVDRLTDQLRMQVKKTAAIKTIVELQLRAEYEGKIRRDSELMEELSRKLKAAKEDAAVLFNENQIMATEFAKVGMRFESPEQFRGLIKEFAAADACANALAKALTESESELSCILNENLILKEKLKNLESDNDQLHGDKKELITQMTSLEKELNHDRLIIDSLQRDVNTYKTRQVQYDRLLAKCKTATELYKSKIKGMREYLTKKSDYVSKERYEQIVESSLLMEKALVEKEMQIKHLIERIRNLENMIKRTHVNESDYSTGKQTFSRDLSSPKHLTVSKTFQQTTRGRAALLQKMKMQSAKGFVSPKDARSVLGMHNSNIAPRITPSDELIV